MGLLWKFTGSTTSMNRRLSLNTDEDLVGAILCLKRSKKTSSHVSRRYLARWLIETCQRRRHTKHIAFNHGFYSNCALLRYLALLRPPLAFCVDGVATMLTHVPTKYNQFYHPRCGLAHQGHQGHQPAYHLCITENKPKFTFSSPIPIAMPSVKHLLLRTFGSDATFQLLCSGS